MGITIIQKSDLNNPKPDPDIALVLAGGGSSGGAFKIGGLMALNRFMLNQQIVNINTYVGTSAGAMISAYLANGVPVKQIVSMLERSLSMAESFRFPAPKTGVSTKLAPIRPSDFYHLNYRDFIMQPIRLCWDVLTLLPRNIISILVRTGMTKEELRGTFFNMLNRPSYQNCEQFFRQCLEKDSSVQKRPSIPWSYIPTGIFSTEKVEQSIRENFEKNNLSNDFTELYEKTGKKLYIVATNLNSSKRVIFGPDQVNSVPISKAIQASIAIPIFYKPVRIGNDDYVDGAVAKTTSLDWAVEKGADLVICYNPFRPFNHEVYCMNCGDDNKRLRVAEDGIYAVINQVMRTLLHTRLMNNLELRRKNPDFKGDVILFEPTEYDDKFFDMNPFAFWERRDAAQRGFDSVKESIAANYDILKKILNTYGIDTSLKFMKKKPDESAPYLETFYENLSM
ncbi:MAG: hypothetical protein GY749_50305 [Desulfobacteraceae bacterium]|nr:hypothetical protein [Desulfobacteraceae bacterium]